MGKKKASGSRNDQDAGDEYDALLASMPMAQACLHNNTQALASMLESCLPQKDVTVHNLTIEKSVGESFTGGRSTPVYFVACQVQRPGLATPKPRSFVIKLVCMPGSNEDAAVVRRRESYAVERRFYQGEAAERIRNADLTIPRMLSSDLDGSKPWPAFCILMNDVSQHFPVHPSFMSVHQAKCALQWLARFHALFWTTTSQHGGASSSSRPLWKRDLWERGAFWTTKSVRSDGISATWAATVRYLEQKHPEYVTPATKGLGQRIQRVAEAISSFLTKQMVTCGTLIHGDYKAANLFFATDETARTNADSASLVAAVDFQFAGGGLAAEDVAYLLYPDARGDFFANEFELLESYHEELVLQLIAQQKGGPSTMPFQVFRRYYELARVDMTRYWLAAKGWSASTEGEAKLVSAMESTLNGIDGGELLANQAEYELALTKFVEG